MRASGSIGFVLACALAVLTALPAQAVQLLRDPDIEYALRRLA